MKKVKVFGLILIFLLLASGMIFAEGQKEGAGQKDKMVVLLMIGMESPYCPPYVSNFTTKLNEAGVKTFMFNGKFDAQLQASQMDDAIAMRPNLIVLFAADSQAIAPGIKKAHDAGISVLMSNNRPVEESEEYVLGYVGPDYYTQGKLAAEMMNALLAGRGNVVMIEGLAGQEAQINRAKGFMDNVDSGINLLARQPADWRKDKAIQVMQDFITRYGSDIDAVYGQDDTLGIGAAIAMEESGIEGGTIPVISIGGSREGLKAVADGVIYGTVMQSPVVETDGLVPVVLDALDKGLTAGDHLDPFWQFMDMPKVTAENVEGYLPGDW